jgi:YHS domain-containing protein
MMSPLISAMRKGSMVARQSILIAMLCSFAAMLVAPVVFAQSDSRSGRSGQHGTRGAAPSNASLLGGPRAMELWRSEGEFAFPTRQNQQFPLALGGFDVVLLHDRRQWHAGSQSVSALFDGQIYRFSDNRSRQIFIARPEYYAPVLGGDSILRWAKSGERSRGDLRYALLYQERLYLFENAAQREKFHAERELLVRADLAWDGICPVTYAQEKKSMPGIPATVAMYRGLRYQFAGMAQRKLFLRNPDQYAVKGSISVDKAGNGAGLVTESSVNPLRHGLASRMTAEGLPVQGSPSRAMEGRGPASRIGGGLSNSQERSQPVAPEQLHDPDRKSGARAQRTTLQPPDSGEPELQQTSSVKGEGPTSEFERASSKKPTSQEPALQQHQRSDVMEPVMGGYCPVSIRAKGIWVLGKDVLRIQYDHQDYMFAGPEEKAAFMNSPERYIPAFGGNCVVSLRELGKAVRGSIFHAVEYEGRLYLFANAEQNQRFKNNPSKYENSDLAMEGYCVVSRIEYDKLVEGEQSQTVWYHNMRYRFAGDKEREMFLAEPEKYIVR